MKYKIIFSAGYDDDQESVIRQLRSDVLIQDEHGCYFNPFFITINRIETEFEKEDSCFLEDNLVILHIVTKENIFKALESMHQWLFYKRWTPLTEEQITKYFGDKDVWSIFVVDIE